MEVRTLEHMNEAACPVSDELLGQLHRASGTEAIEFTRSLSEAQRAQLATFCYNRTHLRDVGLHVASTCSCNALVNAAGVAGRVIYDRSREVKKTQTTDRLNQAPSLGKSASPITLATFDGKKVAA